MTVRGRTFAPLPGGVGGGSVHWKRKGGHYRKATAHQGREGCHSTRIAWSPGCEQPAKIPAIISNNCRFIDALRRGIRKS